MSLLSPRVPSASPGRGSRVLWLRTWPEESQLCKCPAEKAGFQGGADPSLLSASRLSPSFSLPASPLPSASQRWQPLQMETP